MPFTAEQFFEVFARYNQAVFPMQFVLVWAAYAAVLLVLSRKTVSGEIISGILAFLWLWAGIAYHLVFFTRINSGAYIFAAMFIAEGVFFYYEGVVKKQLSFRLKPDVYGYLGGGLIAYALLGYPVAGFWLGHVFPASPTFGAPCPIAILTFGLLLWTGGGLRLYLVILPLLWAIIGSTATWHFGVAEDFGLPVAATIFACFIFRRGFETDRENIHEQEFIKNIGGGGRAWRRFRRL